VTQSLLSRSRTQYAWGKWGEKKKKKAKKKEKKVHVWLPGKDGGLLQGGGRTHVRNKSVGRLPSRRRWKKGKTKKILKTRGG